MGKTALALNIAQFGHNEHTSPLRFGQGDRGTAEPQYFHLRHDRNGFPDQVQEVQDVPSRPCANRCGLPAVDDIGQEGRHETVRGSRDFACHEAGNIFTYLMKVDGLSFP